MTNQRIIYTTSNGNVAVVIPTGEVPIDEVLAKSVPEGTVGLIVEVDEIPVDRSFRNAWKQNGRKIEHDLTKAREIHRARIREARAPMLAELDIAMQRELEKTKPEIAVIASRKQALRDATAAPAIDAAQTVEALKQVWDNTLLGPSPYA